MILEKKIVTIDFKLATEKFTEFDGVALYNKLAQFFEESFLLITCQRVVISAYVTHELELKSKAEELIKVKKYSLYSATEASANFLFSVASGLASKVLGEHEIQGQLFKWLSLGRELRAVGPVLDELVRQAIHCGKVVRTNTSIGSNNLSYASIAKSIVITHFGSIDQHYLLIGTGSIATSFIKILIKLGVSNIAVASHDLARARSFTEKYGGKPLLIENVESYLSRANVVVGGTHGEVIFSNKYHATAVCPRHEIGKEVSEKLIIDFGAPANFPALTFVNAYFGLADITNRLNTNYEYRENQVPAATAEITREVNKYILMFKARKNSQLIGDYWQQLKSFEKEQLDWLFPKIKQATLKEKELIAAFAHRLLRKVAKKPIEKLRHKDASAEPTNSKRLLINKQRN